MEIFKETKSFPRDEKFSLTDQIRRSSRSVASNIAEAYRKRQYPKMFVNKFADSDSEGAETQVWLDFAKDCRYLDHKRYNDLTNGYQEVGRMLGGMMQNSEKFYPQQENQ